MTKSTAWMVVAIFTLSALTSAGPVVVGLVHAVVPLVIAVGCMAIAWRLVWYFTNRY